MPVHARGWIGGSPGRILVNPCLCGLRGLAMVGAMDLGAMVGAILDIPDGAGSP